MRSQNEFFPLLDFFSACAVPGLDEKDVVILGKAGIRQFGPEGLSASSRAGKESREARLLKVRRIHMRETFARFHGRI